ncbi:MAG: nucleotidyltransferase family protein [Clostridia bacterium]|nr:nucleotidyltransferase family protein [Clostridia bacterium]
MNAAFIACEYNPFHNGHLHHIKMTKEHGADAVICIMSGNFVQRGDIAICEKHQRAKAALMSGADLVIELPLKYAVSTASLFADGFIKTAHATGLVGYISFGANNSIDELKNLKDAVNSSETQKFIQSSNKDISYPVALSNYLSEHFGEEYSEMLKDANNTLAIEYLRARDEFFPEVSVFSVLRKGVAHDSVITTDRFASASAIRDIIYREDAEYTEKALCSCEKFLPTEAFSCYRDAYSSGQFPTSKETFEKVCISRLLSLDNEYFLNINNVTAGIENRITDAIKNSSSLNEICNIIKTKRYTLSRIRQILLSAVLGITRDDINNDISYIRILGFNEKGREVLHEMKRTAKLPVIMNLSQIDSNNKKAVRDAYLDMTAAKIYNLCLPCPLSGNAEYDIPPIYIR